MHLALKSAMSRIPYTNKVGETLSSIADSAAAYSLRALGGGDPIVARVRRSSDDAEKDFTASDVGSGSVADWVGSGNDGFVHTLYDQSGNSNDFTQSTAANQPKIVDAGSISERNGKPIVKFVQANQTYMQSTSSIAPAGTNFDITVFHAMHIDHSDGGRLGVFGSEASGNNPAQSEYLFGSGSTSNIVVKFRDNASNVTTLQTDAVPNNTDSILTYNFGINSGNIKLSLFNNSFQVGNTKVGNTNSQSYSHSTTILLGARSTVDNFSDSEFFEIIVYDSDQSANRAAIETNINNYYDIY
jgi:hypothetical protein